MANERNSSVEQHVKTTTSTLTTALHTSYTTRLHVSFIFTPKYGAKQPWKVCLFSPILAGYNVRKGRVEGEHVDSDTVSHKRKNHDREFP